MMMQNANKDYMSKQVVFIRPNDILFSYDLIIVDIYNQLRNKMQLDDIKTFRTLIESSYNENQYLFSIAYTDNEDMYFINDITRTKLSVDMFDQLVVNKKHSLITEKAWVWLLESGYTQLVFQVNITFFNHSIVDIEDGFDLFVLTHDSVYPETFYVSRFFRDKNKLSTKVIAIDRLADWFRDQLKSDDSGNIETIWLADTLTDPLAVMRACIEYHKLEDRYIDKIQYHTRLAITNEDNMKYAAELAEQEIIAGNIGLLNAFKISKLDQINM